jgi:hypothetical protein
MAMYMKCELCHEPLSQVQVVVYGRSERPYVVFDDRVLSDPALVAKFVYFCATKGLQLNDNRIVDMCESCLRLARVELN